MRIPLQLQCQVFSKKKKNNRKEVFIMIAKVLSGTAILIGMYLILSRSKDTVSVINSLGSTYTSSVKMLQGR